MSKPNPYFLFIILAFNLLSLRAQTHAQNLVLDPSFEAAQHHLISGTWQNLRHRKNGADLWDAEHPEDNINYGLYGSSVAPYKGHQIVGMTLVNGDTWNITGREFLRGNLSQELEKGRAYRISIKVRKAVGDRVLAMTDIGVLLSKDSVSFEDVSDSKVRFLPLRGDSKFISPTRKWEEISQIYHATGGEQHITIGGFLGASYKYLSENSKKGVTWSYYFMDDVQVVAVSEASAEVETKARAEPAAEEVKVKGSNRILFAYDSDKVNDEDFPLIEKIATQLQQDTSLQIVLSGYTDNKGSTTYNYALSQKRVNALKQTLVQKGVNGQQIFLKAFGSKHKIASNESEQGRQLNRRVEVRFIYKDDPTEFQIKAIQDFTKLYGYVRYFYPEDLREDLDWNLFAAYGVSQLRKVDNKQEVLSTLKDLFKDIAPEVQICNDMDCFQNDPITKDYKFWQHIGFYTGRNDAYESKLVNTQDKKNWLFEKEPSKTKIKEKGLLNLNFEIPLKLAVQKNYDGPKLKLVNDEIRNALILDQDKFIGNTIIAWNIIQHTYPYFEYLNLDWESELSPLLIASSSVKEDIEFTRFLKAMAALLQDGHAAAYSPAESSHMFLPFHLDWIANDFVVTESGHEAIIKGDIIKTIDEIDVSEIFENYTTLISGSNQWKVKKALSELGAEKYYSMASLLIERSEKATELNVKRDWGNFPVELIKELEEDIFYVDLTMISDMDTLLNYMDRFQDAKAIIFNIRGYFAGSASELLPHLVTVADTIDNWIQTPLITEPNQSRMTYEKEGWGIQPKAPKFPGKYFFLTDGSAISACESFLSLVKYYKLGKIIGSPTAGANGSRNSIGLLMGYTFNWTGMYVTDLDGNCYHNIGLQPDVIVSPTTWKNDEVLEKALELARQ